MNIFFRVDSSNIIGTGHVFRCLNIAYHYNSENIFFICKNHNYNINSKIPYKLFELESSNNLNTNINSWLGESEEDDAKKTIEIIKNYEVDWLIIDHYSINKKWENMLKKYVKKILVIDDYIDRVHDCDIVLNQQFSQEEGDRIYKKSYCGNDYLILHHKYFNMNVEKKISKRIERINIFMGGADTPNITENIIFLLKDYDIILDVIIGKSNNNYQEILELTKNIKNVNIYYDLDFIGDLFLQADLCIGSLGGTSYERCLMKTPSLCVCIAENQKTVLDKFINSGVIKYVGMYNENYEKNILYWINYFNNNIHELEVMSERCSNFIDIKNNKIKNLFF